MKHLLTVLITISSHLGIAQYYPDCTRIFEVTSSDGLTIRKEADINSDIIFKIPSGYHISGCNYSSGKSATVNGVKGNWIPVKYQDKDGFMFDAYLERVNPINITSPYIFNPEAEYHTVSEEQIKNDPFYQRKTWGMIHTSSDVAFDVKPFYYRDYIDSTNKIDHNKLHQDGIHYELHSWDSTKENRVFGNTINKTLLPGYSTYYRTKSAEYSLAAIGTVVKNTKDELDPLTTISDFSLILRAKNDNVITEQEIIRFEAKRWVGRQYLDRIHLQWIGDLDQDGGLDILLSFSEHHECYNSLLFLSSESEPGYLIKLVNSTVHCGG